MARQPIMRSRQSEPGAADDSPLEEPSAEWEELENTTETGVVLPNDFEEGDPLLPKSVRSRTRTRTRVFGVVPSVEPICQCHRPE